MNSIMDFDRHELQAKDCYLIDSALFLTLGKFTYIFMCPLFQPHIECTFLLVRARMFSVRDW